MARVGISNYIHSLMGPVSSDSYWRECNERTNRIHRYHPLNLANPRTSMVDLTTTTGDFSGRPWHHLHQTYTFAAGKSSYHHSVRKPLGFPTHPSQQSSNSELPGRGLSNAELLIQNKESTLLSTGKHVMSDPNMPKLGDIKKFERHLTTPPPDAIAHKRDRTHSLSRSPQSRSPVPREMLEVPPSVRSGHSNLSYNSR